MGHARGHISAVIALRKSRLGDRDQYLNDTNYHVTTTIDIGQYRDVSKDKLNRATVTI